MFAPVSSLPPARPCRVCADVNRADRPRGSIFQRDDPDWVATIVRPERVTQQEKVTLRCFRGVARDRVGAGRVEIEARRVDRAPSVEPTAGRLGGRCEAMRSSSTTISRTPPRAPGPPKGSSTSRLRIAVDARDRNDTAHHAAIQLRSDDAQSFIGAWIFLRQSRRGEEERGAAMIST